MSHLNHITPRSQSNLASRELLGSLNPQALTLPILQHSPENTIFSEFADLSLEIDELTEENSALKEEINEIINSDDNNPFFQFKKMEIEFQKRLERRDKELEEFSKYLTSFRTTDDNTFVEINAKKKQKNANFDYLAYTLLVTNKQRNFFSTEDIERQNEDLKILIENQNETIRLLKSRLNTYSHYYNETAAEKTIDALKNGFVPSKIQGATPSRTTELKNKKKLMVERLKELIEMRKKALEPKLIAKNKKREERIKNQKAIIIQKAARGYLARKKVREMNEAAVKIQSLWRGVVARLGKRKLAPKENEKFRVKKIKLNLELTNQLLKMKRSSEKGSAKSSSKASGRSSSRSDKSKDGSANRRRSISNLNDGYGSSRASQRSRVSFGTSNIGFKGVKSNDSFKEVAANRGIHTSQSTRIIRTGGKF